MIENKKRLYIFGTAALSVLVILVIYFSLIATGALNLIQNNLVISSGSISKVYDGEVLVNHEYEVKSGKVKSKETINVTFTEELTDIGVVENKFIVIINDENGNVVTSKYDIEYIYGKLEVRTLPIKISTGSASKIYDGSPITNSEYTLLSGSLLEGHEMEITVNGTLTNVGETDNTFIFVVLNEYGVDVTSMYDLETLCGKLIITGKVVTISSLPADKEYDGTPLTSAVFEYNQIDLLDGHEIYISSTATITTPGVIDNTFSYVIRNKEGLNVTGYYEVIENYGKLTIFQKSITVTSKGLTETYNGESYSNTEIEHDPLIDGHILIASSFTEVINVTLFSVMNQFTYKIVDKDNNVVTPYYHVNSVYGYITIEKYEIDIVTSNETYEYTGDLQYQDDFYIRDTTPLISGHNLKIDENIGESYPGSYYNQNTYLITDEDGNFVTKNYTINTNSTSMVILPIELTIQTGSSTQKYNGLPLTVKDNNVVTGELISGHSLIIDVTGTITSVGEEDNTATAYVKDSNENIISNLYSITINYGTLIVEYFEVNVITPDLNYIYDGTTRILSELEENVVSYNNLPAGFDIIINFTTSIKNVGTISNSAEIGIFLNNELDDNFIINKQFGTVTVLKSEITVMTGSVAYPYTGGTYSHEEFTIISGNTNNITINDYHYIEVSEVGCYYNVASFIIIEDGETDTSANYSVIIINGNITIYDKITTPMHLTPKSDRVAYTSESIEYSDLFDADNCLLGFDYWAMQGYSYEVVVGYSDVETAISAGKYVIKIKDIKIFDFEYVDVTDTFNITTSTGVVEIIDKLVTISSDGMEVTYTGEIFAETVDDIRIDLDSKYTYELSVYGGMSSVGSFQMNYTLTIYDGDEDVTDDFLIKNNLGYITINPIEVEVEIGNVIANVGDKIADIDISFSSNLQTGDRIEIIIIHPIDTVIVENAVYTVQISFKVYNSENKDITDCFTFNIDEITFLAN